MQNSATPILTFAGLLLVGCIVATDTAAGSWEDAIRTNELDAIRSLYPERSDVDQANEHGKTALMAAAAAGDAQLVEELLAAGADPTASNKLDGTVLMYAVGGGDRQIVERLLTAGVGLDGQASNGWSALMMAAAKDLGELITLLAGAGADPNLPDIYGWTPLMRASYEGHRAAAEALLERPELDLDHRNRNGQNALHLAVIAGRAGMVERLLASGLPQASDVNGHTPQSIASELGRDDLLQMLQDAESGDASAKR
ncbi:ankyrin repeat domain-containing protein [Wenzhouxiangella limi]|uniref:Ankyrin repeat domain-containing protein n=1 Tax=Wenzhouxiangella limi TaxID=2707351 RepID=A0A845UX37_9GAMM|nr:ankyrin repeat domain-containing protein [Wenzhouxiangella limi]NDY95064.1 ankyrin repeat domain-containing protein [Wenzhouxiangella limi]